MKQLHEQLQAAGIKEDVWTFSALFLACQSCGNRWQEALALHCDMEAAGVRPEGPALVLGRSFDRECRYGMVKGACGAPKRTTR